jgi:rRNA maturation RNase YbeY
MKVIAQLYSPNVDIYSEKLLSNIAEETIKTSGIFSDEKEFTVSVAIVTEKDIRKINKKLRNKNAITDVISIGDYSDEKDINEVLENEIFLGEVILCYTYIEVSAKENKVDVNKEFFTVYSHGILHLLGFKHGEKMFKIQDDVSKKFCSI